MVDYPNDLDRQQLTIYSLYLQAHKKFLEIYLLRKTLLQQERKFKLQAKLHKNILLEDIEKLEKVEEVHLLTSEEFHKLSKTRTEILEYYRREEIFWCQIARNKWLKEGCEDSIFPQVG